MSLVERYLSWDDLDRPIGADLVANPNISQPPRYLLLFLDSLDLRADAITQALQSYHPLLSNARVELEKLPPEKMETDAPRLIGLAGWGNHVIKFAGFDRPVAETVFEACVRPAHIVERLKSDAGKHRSHVLLEYAGRDFKPLERYVALTLVAVALARFGGILLLNESARTAFPAEALLADEEGDRIDSWRLLPLPLLYGGFVKVEVEGQPGVWMRTFGGETLGLPDLALLAASDEQGNEIFDLFATWWRYLLNEGFVVQPGVVVRTSLDQAYRFRAAEEAEWYLHSEGALYVAEPIHPDDVDAL